MKKLYTTKKYKEWHKRKLKALNLRQQKKQRYYDSEKGTTGVTKFRGSSIVLPPIVAPSDFRLIENSDLCLLFFRNLRDNNNYNRHTNGRKFVSMTLKDVEKIDYATISLLTAVSDELKAQKVILRGDFPENQIPKDFLIDSGFLNHMYDKNNKRYPSKDKSEMIFFEKGCGTLSDKDNRKIGEMVKNVVLHLSGEKKHFNPVKTILLEICGNSIEHAYTTESRNWLLGIKYSENTVTFTVTDVGKGILQTLHRKFDLELRDKFLFKRDDEILMGAFDQKYGSSTLEENRNKGLPAIKDNFEKGTIHNLKVLTNNVILHFDKKYISRTFEKGSPRLKGTLYQWELIKECLERTQ